MQLNTQVSLPKPPFTLTYTDNMLLLGSCFAESIGQKLSDYKFSVDVNPFGPLYNLYSIHAALKILQKQKVYTAQDLVAYEGLYHSMDHHSRFSAPTAQECLSAIHARIKKSYGRLKETQVVIITLGTSYVYLQKDSGKIVANCHKLPDKLFERKVLSVEEQTIMGEQLVSLLTKINPNIRIIFTVSPIRHWKDGAHANQLSKAALLLAIDKIIQKDAHRITYFPAYEIMMDELRDYRFYADDMVHPSQLAVNYIWERFCESFVAYETLSAMKEWENIHKALQHKPFNPQSEAYRKFIIQTLLKMEHITDKFPSFDIQNEIQQLKSKLY